MTNEEFIQCWVTACNHKYAHFYTMSTGGHLDGTWWHINVGELKLSLFYAPYTEGRHDRSIIEAVGQVNDQDVIKRLTNAQSAQCINLWEQKQLLEPNITYERVLSYLERE